MGEAPSLVSKDTTGDVQTFGVESMCASTRSGDDGGMVCPSGSVTSMEEIPMRLLV